LAPPAARQSGADTGAVCPIRPVDPEPHAA